MKDALSVNTAKPTVDIVIITYNNMNMLDRCVCSIKQNTSEPVRIIIVNNGDKFDIPSDPNIVILKAPKNLGWTHGVNAGVEWVLAHNPAPFIIWMNDDTQILPHDNGWLTKMLNCFQLDPKIAVVGPTSNNIMGFQTTNHLRLPPAIETTYLSGMCMLVRRSVVEEMGPLDQCDAGGDDLDFSIRLRDKGYKLCCCRRSFMLHFCSITGKKVFGDYWNSPIQGEEINNWLIKKHGFKKWMDCINNHLPSSPSYSEGNGGFDFISPENELALKELSPELDYCCKVLDLGCGGQKIDKRAIGVDIRKNGVLGVGANQDRPSNADIEADITCLPMDSSSVDAILAKHIFEHLIDPIKSLKEWARVLRNNGKLVIICPDYRYCEAISVDPSHVHAYTPDSVCSLLEVCGFGVMKTKNILPGYVFMVSARKIPTMLSIEKEDSLSSDNVGVNVGPSAMACS